ncbi:hypothetical protein [Oxobacter pfennigii]|nr:hypothetical protein [Oxobacter pfennigii]
MLLLYMKVDIQTLLVKAIEDYLDYHSNRRYQRKLVTLMPMEAHEVLLSA